MKPVFFTAIVVSAFLVGTALAQPQEKAQQPQNQRPEVAWNNPDGSRPNGVEHRSYKSPSMDVDIGYNVYLPPGYAESNARYPVIYFLHGAGGNENSDVGGFCGVVARLIEQKKIAPTIVVFPNGKGRSGYRDNAESKVLAETMIIKELVPLIDKDLRTKATRDARTITGFSMGGGGAVRLALKYPDLFSAAGSWAGALGGGARGGGQAPVELQVDNMRALNGKVRLLLIVGDEDQSTFASHKPFIEKLDQAKYPYSYKELSGVRHDLGRLISQTGDELVVFLAEKP